MASPPDGNTEADLLGAFEEHSPDDIRQLLAAGVSPTQPIHGKRPIDCLIETYLRFPRFAECTQIMLDAGATIDDPVLEAILLDNDVRLRGLLSASSATAANAAFRHLRALRPVRVHVNNPARGSRGLLPEGAFPVLMVDISP
jgi:hypothetical protein